MKVGEYVRLDRCQGINKIDEEDEIGTFYLEDVIGDEWGDETFRLDTNDVIKSSPNIIDLIEVGDYVNGVEVINIDDEWITMSDKQVPILKSIANGMIKSVITHEQMEQMAYKVGE